MDTQLCDEGKFNILWHAKHIKKEKEKRKKEEEEIVEPFQFSRVQPNTEK